MKFHVNALFLALSLLIMSFAIAATADDGSPQAPGDYMHHIQCRIVVFLPGQPFSVLTDVEVDTLSGNPADYTFSATTPAGRRFTATFQHVNIDPVGFPKDRFAMSIYLDGKLHFRTGHTDLDAYFDLYVDGLRHGFHCMPPLEE